VKYWECAATQRKKVGSFGIVLATLGKILKNSHTRQDRRKGNRKVFIYWNRKQHRRL